MASRTSPARPWRAICLGTLAYTVTTFAWALAWHLWFFRPLYEAWGYIDESPNLALGLLSILAQGALLSWLYPRLAFAGNGPLRGLKFGLATGAFYWTCHVLAFAAKQDAAAAPLFFTLETAYLAVQFAAFGLLIGAIYAAQPDRSS